MAGVVTVGIGPVDGLDYHVGLAYYPEGVPVDRWDVAVWDGGGVTWEGDPPITDVSCDVKELRIARGRDQPLDRFRPGALTFTLYDPNGVYTPWRTASDETGFTAIRPGVEVVVWLDDGTTTYPRFHGILDSIVDSFPDPSVPTSHEVAITAFDDLSTVAAFDGYELPAVGAGETAGARIARILANAQYVDAVDLDPGTLALQATTLAKNALDEIGLVTDTDGGAFYATRDGVLVYVDTNGLVTDPRFTTVQATFGEVEPEICYTDLQLADDLSHVRNHVSIANEGGTAVTVSDTGSIGLYKPRTYRRFDLIHVDPTASTAIANRHLTAFAYAVARIEGFTVDLLLLDAAQRLDVIALDFLYRIQIRRRAEGFQVVADLQVQAIGESVTADSWTIEINTFDAAATSIFDVGRWDVDVWNSGEWGY